MCGIMTVAGTGMNLKLVLEKLAKIWVCMVIFPHGVGTA
jgi:hypothetical protein